jgi:hypothetical protein
LKMDHLKACTFLPKVQVQTSETPPAERVASGSPLEGGVHIGKAPLGLWLNYSKSSSNCC